MCCPCSVARANSNGDLCQLPWSPPDIRGPLRFQAIALCLKTSPKGIPKEAQGSQRSLRRQQSFRASPLASIISSRRECLIDSHRADLHGSGSNPMELKHCKRLMAIPRRLFNLIANLMMKFDPRELSARRYVRNGYLGKVTPWAISLW